MATACGRVACACARIATGKPARMRRPTARWIARIVRVESSRWDCYVERRVDEHRHGETMAVARTSSFRGLWVSEGTRQPWGWRISSRLRENCYEGGGVECTNCEQGGTYIYSHRSVSTTASMIRLVKTAHLVFALPPSSIAHLGWYASVRPLHRPLDE